MFKKIALGTMLTTMACGAEERVQVVESPTVDMKDISFDEYLKLNVDEPIRPHFAEFMEFCKLSSSEDNKTCLHNLKRLKSVRLKFGVLDESNPTVIGRCDVSFYRRVIIRADFADTASLSFKALVWHELGHCLLNLDHIEGSNSHLMNPNLPSARALQLNWTNLVKDLFENQVKFSLIGFLISDLSR